MSGARLAVIMLALGALVLALMTRASGDRIAASRQPAYPAQLATGAGQELAAQHCLMCHSAMLITQQAKDSTGWEKTLGLMEKWSAPLPAEEHQKLRAYLLQHYPPRPPR